MWNIRDGNTARVWWDNWIGTAPLRGLTEGPLKQEEANMLVSDLFGDNLGWNWDCVSFPIPEQIINLVTGIPRDYSILNQSVKLIHSNGKILLIEIFSIKSALGLMLTDQTSLNGRDLNLE